MVIYEFLSDFCWVDTFSIRKRCIKSETFLPNSSKSNTSLTRPKFIFLSQVRYDPDVSNASGIFLSKTSNQFYQNLEVSGFFLSSNCLVWI